MTQLEFTPAVYEQQRQLARVTGKIGLAVLKFCAAHVGQTFHASDLYAAVEGVAPASADRVLRDLRRKGMVNYKVVSRTRSEYRILEVTH